MTTTPPGPTETDDIANGIQIVEEFGRLKDLFSRGEVIKSPDDREIRRLGNFIITSKNDGSFMRIGNEVKKPGEEITFIRLLKEDGRMDISSYPFEIRFDNSGKPMGWRNITKGYTSSDDSDFIGIENSGEEFSFPIFLDTFKAAISRIELAEKTSGVIESMRDRVDKVL